LFDGNMGSYSFSSVWVTGAKTTGLGPIAKKVCFFLNLIFSAERNLKFHYDHSDQ
jgi:hypothetical protein